MLKCGDLKIEGGLEALVDEETWEVVQKRRRSYKKRLRSTREHPKRGRSPYLLSGLAVCAECGDAMTGGTDNLKRRHLWPHYVCGRKKRKGWHSCPTGKISSQVLDQAVLDTVIERVLTPDYVLDLVKEVNAHLALDGGDVDREISGVRRQLADIEKAIENLLDQVEQFGAQSAGDRLVTREVEREGLVGRLQKLERRRELRKLQIDPKMVKTILTGMRGTLAGDDLQAKRVLLKRFIERVEVSKESAKLVYTCPIPDTVCGLGGVSATSPWGYSLRHCIEIDLAAGVEVD